MSTTTGVNYQQPTATTLNLFAKGDNLSVEEMVMRILPLIKNMIKRSEDMKRDQIRLKFVVWEKKQVEVYNKSRAGTNVFMPNSYTATGDLYDSGPLYGWAGTASTIVTAVPGIIGAFSGQGAAYSAYQMTSSYTQGLDGKMSRFYQAESGRSQADAQKIDLEVNLFAEFSRNAGERSDKFMQMFTAMNEAINRAAKPN